MGCAIIFGFCDSKYFKASFYILYTYFFFESYLVFTYIYKKNSVLARCINAFVPGIVVF